MEIGSFLSNRYREENTYHAFLSGRGCRAIDSVVANPKKNEYPCAPSATTPRNTGKNATMQHASKFANKRVTCMEI